jgi:basic membrane lipoprotein Med (substrate-binding protein (PBP1-ABC) superfamily)/DNA-binding SARP family transcriptional activator
VLRRDAGSGHLTDAAQRSGSYDRRVRFEVLGRLRGVAPVPAGGQIQAGGQTQAGGERPLGGPKQRLVLALLLAEPNTTVSIERLIDGVWGESPPGSARHTLQSYVSELRKSLGEIIEREGTGYAIHVDRDSLDALEFEARVSEARARLDRDPEAAVAELDAALALWHGRPFEDFPDQPTLQADATRLDELRLAAIEAALAARLALGEHVAVAVELDRLTRAYPYREELRALQMLALYRSGRQADALRAFQATREVLGEELGIVPSPRLRRLEEQILLQDPDLEPARTPFSATAPSDTRVDNPYMGLRAFRESDASRFFGQDRLVGQLTERVMGAASFTAVVGPSGSGKSSAVQAGLLPQLRRDSPDVRIAMLQPGSQPFAELEAALGRLAGDERRATLTQLRATDAGLLETAIRLLDSDSSRLLLVVDQFEELFTLADPSETEDFLATLVRATQDPRHRIHVLVTMRADFYDRPLAAPRFGPVFAANVVNVVALGPDELEAAATLPARQLDVTVEPRLVGRLIADVAGQPNALPLFQYALTELFDERTGPVLDLATYERIGGVRKAVARRAEALYTGLDGPEQEAVRQLFLRIATVSGAVVGRRRVPASELAALDVDIVALQAAIESFARYRLLALDRDPTTGAPIVEVAHEALLAEWHRLREWIDESRDDLATQARFAVAVNEWEASGRDAGYLLTGSRLDHYERWAATSRLKLTETEHAFIGQAVTAREAEHDHDLEREAEAARLRRRSRRQLASLFVAIVVLAGIVGYPIVTAGDRPRQLAVALSSPRAASAYDELVARGVEMAAEEHGWEAVVLEPPYTNLRRTLAELAEDADLVFGETLMWNDMIVVARDHPGTRWVFLDLAGDPPVPNGIALSTASEEGSFLVGAAAALETETSRIGYIGANGSPIIEDFRAGFEQGARAARPGVEIVAALIEPEDTIGQDGYLDPERARQIAEWMYAEEDVDIIFTAAGGSGQGVVAAAAALSDELGRHLWAIGVDSDLLFELPAEQRDHLLTSMLKRLDTAMARVVADDEAGVLEFPGSIRLGLVDEAVGYSTAGDHLSASTIAAVDELGAAVAGGEIDVDTTPTGPLSEPPPAPEAPDSPAVRAAVDVAQQYFAALQAGDVRAAMELFSPDATIRFFLPWSVDDFEIGLTMESALGSRFLAVACTAYAPTTGLEVVCTYDVHDGVSQAVGGPVVHETATIAVDDGAITSFERNPGTPDYLLVDDRFAAWMEAHHPDDAEAVEWAIVSIDDARRRGELRARYAAEWAAYLEAEGCSFTEAC